ncbi:hypothetical protein R3D73_005219 [Serratia marcescens]|nr:hypothetical protein [Serratia marcescens]ELQ9442310.1 hypothetical protein [Serratia marcescens]ELT5563070.1 hypothetical protein [Serratia marcescens]
MTAHNDDNGMAPMTPAKKGLLQSHIFWGAAAGVVVVLVAGLVGTGAIRHVDQRIALLEQAQKTLASQDGMNAMTDALQMQAKQLKSLAERQDALTRQIGARERTTVIQEKLEQQLQAQQGELNALQDRMESVKKSAVALPSEKPAPAAAPSTAVPPAPSTTAQIPPKPTPMTSSLRNTLPRVARKAPFVLTGVEQRGTTAFAAVAPQGFRDLSQVRLIGEGESVAGWTLVSAGFRQATFRVNGRLQTVSIR